MCRIRCHGRIAAAIAAGLLFGSAQPSTVNAQAAAVAFNIESQPLAKALNEWATQAELQVVWPAGDSSAYSISTPVQGTLDPMDALRVLLKGTGLTFSVVSQGRTVAIRDRERSGRLQGTVAPLSSRNPSFIRLAAGVEEAPRTSAGSTWRGDASGTSRAEVAEGALDEVVVTGSHIRGSTQTSPVSTFDRLAIDRSGAGTVAHFLQTLPGNSNPVTEVSSAAVAGGRQVENRVNGAGVNLRGLGTESTLVLVNGRRLAPGNTIGDFVDISMIPLSAVDRIEVVMDGASAIYGSDAVGGVVNIILRRDVQGIETRARYGTVDSGGHREAQFGSSAGYQWDTGSALLSYEFLDSTPLSASARSFSSTASRPFMLLPDQRRHSAFIAGQQALAPSVNIFAEGTFGSKSGANVYTDPFASHREASDVRSYSMTAGTRASLPKSFELEVSGTYGSSNAEQQIYNDDGLSAELIASDTEGESTITSTDVQLSGDLGRLPAGAIQFALGGQYRRETFDRGDRLNPTADFDNDRDVYAAFLELRVPLVEGSQTARSLPRLELTLAGRYEHFSDFGSSSNPKIGLAWRPADDVTFRGTYGKSFRAPALNDLNGSQPQVIPIPLADRLKTGECDLAAPTDACTNTLFIFGGNESLEPEKAETWSAGIDYRSAAVPGLRGSITYYSIEYDNRITSPGLAVDIFDFLTSDPILGPTVIQRDPSPQTVQSWVAAAGSNFFNYICECDLATIGAIADNRSHNLSSVRTNGLDFDFAYAVSLERGQLDLGLTSTKILKFETRFTVASPTLGILNTAYNPIDLRLRAHGTYALGSVATSVFVNYVDSYSNIQNSTAVPVASWTTVDVSGEWQPIRAQGVLTGLSIGIGIRNVADKAPPFVFNSAFPINFDGRNADPLGRFYYAQLAKRF
jgi:iron complex outermembrane recepter protein